MNKIAVFYESGLWQVAEMSMEMPQQPISIRATCSTFEEAIKTVAIITGGPVLIELVTA